MSQINRSPKGFLDLVGAQQQGQNPPQYSDAVAPVIDLRDLYLGQTLGFEAEQVNHAAIGTQLQQAVPAGETWLLIAAGFHVSLPSTASIEQWMLSIVDPPRPNFISGVPWGQLWTSRVVTVAVNGDFSDDAVTFGNPIVLHSGTIVRWFLGQRDGGAARNTALNLTFYRLNS